MTETITTDLVLTCVMSAVALAAVWFPLYRGLRLCLEARAATRRLDGPELKRRMEQSAGAPGEPLALLMVRTLVKTLREGSGHPREFIVDATRQYVVNEYDAQYARRISMYANLLPPIGFIGTTTGLLVLFIAMHLADGSLELGALAIALTSSIFALIGFSALEGLKIRLYGRLLACLDEVLELQRRSEETRAAKAG
ncbi:MAG: hypothetical protein ACQGVC_10020 [Myxococcota bacterium]